MAERRTRRRFTAEFKAEAVKRLLGGGKALSEVATELGIGPSPGDGDRAQPGVEAADARADDAAQHGHGMHGSPARRR